MDWCGGEAFDGCLIFDECHKAKHFIPGKEENSTKVALAVTTIQRLLPKARVVYCSATGVTDVKNMAFMERLGLWGVGTAFRSFQSFLDSITKRGLGAAEMLAMEMKASGMYVSRGLSFRQAEFMNAEAVLTDDQRKVYDTSVHVWNEIKTSLEYAVARTKSATPRLWSQFWSCHQRFFKQLCMSMKVPTIVQEAKTALQNNMSVVIGLQTTGEASLESELNRNGGTINRFISITEEIMTRFILQFFPTKIETKDGTVVEDKWSVTAKSLLLGFIKKIGLPISPLDDLIDQLGGPGHVAEMTGRRGRVVRTASDREPHYEARESDSTQVESLNIQERNHFMDGSKLVAIISDAASTGISLHSDLRVANQKRRVHFTMELPWSADKAVQQLGRSHRSNQRSGPIYKLVTTNLGGERRFAAAVARRLQSLGALTKGDRRAATGADLNEFNFDTNYGRSALRSMYQCISSSNLQPGVSLQQVIAGAQISTAYELDSFHETLKECIQMMGLADPGSSTVKEKDSGDVARFLNRILGLSVERQNMFFSYFVECMNAVIEGAKREGRFNEGVTDITGSSIKMIDKPRPVFTEVQKCIMPTHHVILNVDRGVDWESALSRFNHSSKADLNGFYCSKREQKHQRFYLLALQKESSTHLFNIIRPNTGQSPFEEEKKDLLHKYQKISPEEAESGWRAQYDKTKDYCFHGPNCKSGALCRVGCRISQVSLLCGGIVPILSTLEWVVARNADKIGLTRENRTLRVVRVELDDGQRLVGLRYPEQLIPEVTSLLKEQHINDRLLENKSGSLSIKDSLKSTALATEESVAAINNKTLAKAINPPITIKTFFRPVESSDQTEIKAKDVENPECNPENTDGGELVVVDKSTKDCIKETKFNGALTSSYFGAPKATGSTASKVGAKSSGAKTSVSKRGRGGKTSLKRPMSSDVTGSTSKRQKQSSIFSALGRGRENDVTDTEKSSMTCPICRKVFEEGTKNADINAHVDSCLIE
ncbi:protein FORGETTER 1-like [Actinia tenebrosa]|uniref:Protein FORGETTER 1-like n=1 Tax=Actinia tenebrosa TaxID=6105 RepID=A0A6P8II56_ACTTE|nr:protein FORGETTER 1-like [Actinia tenebrosa]